jgi:hypothetical protein
MTFTKMNLLPIKTVKADNRDYSGTKIIEIFIVTNRFLITAYLYRVSQLRLSSLITHLFSRGFCEI